MSERLRPLGGHGAATVADRNEHEQAGVAVALALVLERLSWLPAGTILRESAFGGRQRAMQLHPGMSWREREAAKKDYFDK